MTTEYPTFVKNLYKVVEHPIAGNTLLHVLDTGTSMWLHVLVVEGRRIVYIRHYGTICVQNGTWNNELHSTYDSLCTHLQSTNPSLNLTNFFSQGGTLPPVLNFLTWFPIKDNLPQSINVREAREKLLATKSPEKPDESEDSLD